jgi:hypothetical protein
MWFDREFLAAFTPPGADFPPYVNISYQYSRNNQPDKVELIVRGFNDGKPGETVSMSMSRNEFSLFLASLNAKWNKILANE